MITKLINEIPKDLWDRNGSIFYTGSKAFENKNRFYILGINPGGSPENHQNQTLKHHTNKLCNKEYWSEYKDEIWQGKEPGTSPHQRRVLHLLKKLNLSPHLTPASNVIFLRSRSPEELDGNFTQLANICWPFHKKVIETLGVENILCFGRKAGYFVRQKLEANYLIGEYVENNKRKWRTQIYQNKVGQNVVFLTHPSWANWINPNSDPSEFIISKIHFNGERHLQ